MSKYFKEEKTPELKLSEYLEKEEDEFKGCLFDEKSRKIRTKYLIELLGDITLDLDVYKLFIKQFQTYGGRYDVRTKPETIKDIYGFVKRYPTLTATAIEEIWFIYIKDQFEEYALIDMLEKYIQLHGKKDDTLLSYLDFVDRKAKEFDKRFEAEAKTLESYKTEYGEEFVKHLQYIIKSQHIPAKKIISSLPCKELIIKDKEHLREIATRTRIFMGMCQPISYQMVESLATDEGLDCFPEQPAYLINGETQVEATFTKDDFLASIKKHADEAASKQLKKV